LTRFSRIKKPTAIVRKNSAAITDSRPVKLRRTSLGKDDGLGAFNDGDVPFVWTPSGTGSINISFDYRVK
jgi:hypothetical protein